jgi:isoleucyl-tRNA synthetase
LIGRGLKPVFWSPSSLTALAEAEIDYVEDHVSRSVYFAVETIEIPSIGLENISLLLWTTTPWTIPANLAISINPNITYSIISHPNVLNGSRLIVSTEALENLNSISGESFQIEGSIKGEYLLGTRYRHPLTSKVYKVLSGGDAVNSTSGTGLVHIAPGHGIEDYQLGLKYDLPIFSPVDETGKFTAEAGNNLEGLDVLGKGTDAVIKLLQERNSLWKEVNYKHKYPYDWRTKLPVIFRATQQWFVHLDLFRGKVLSEIEKVNWRSNASKQRMRTLIASRNEWCLSRQRCWGVPIPAFYHKVTGEPLVNNEIINTVADIFRKEGSSAWWKKDIREFFPPSAKLSPDNFRKGYDTMDVWFDSGISWRAVVERSSSLSFPADLYLEGTDQYRGWFQSSILTAIASENSPPYKSVLSHGFVLDENGCKMSKSLGNVIDPIELIQGTKAIPSIGADTFRLWVASVDYTADSLIGKTIINQVTESYKKIRNTMRFILGNLHDFDPLQHNVQYNNLPDVDKYILGSSSKLVELADLNYDQFQFFKLYPALMHFINTDLSSFYFDISKDRLYLAAPNSLRRRAFQTTANFLLRHLLCIIAPILPHLAEEVWMHLPYTKTAESVFLSGWIPPGQIFFPFEEDKWFRLRHIKSLINKCIENSRQAKLIGSSLECEVLIGSENQEFMEFLSGFDSENKVESLSKLFLVSSVKLGSANLEKALDIRVSENCTMKVLVQKAMGEKCQRCWVYSKSIGHNKQFNDLCNECAMEVIQSRKSD